MKYMPLLAVAVICYFLGILTSNFFAVKPVPDTDPVNPLYAQPIENPEVETTIKEVEPLSDGIKHVYYLQLGTFKTPYFAQQLASKLKKKGYVVMVKPLKINQQSLQVVEIGPFSQYSHVNKHRKILSDNFPDLGKMMIKKRIKP